MYFINHMKPNEWWQFDTEKMRAYNFLGGFHYVTEEDIKRSEIIEFSSWHELYLAKNYCPFEVDVWNYDIWISPEGKYYEGKAHALQAEYICEIIYGVVDEILFYEDYIEKLGWIRATTSLMWDVRFDNWNGKRITQKQYDALWDWCECHQMKFPKGIETY